MNAAESASRRKHRRIMRSGTHRLHMLGAASEWPRHDLCVCDGVHPHGVDDRWPRHDRAGRGRQHHCVNYLACVLRQELAVYDDVDEDTVDIE